MPLYPHYKPTNIDWIGEIPERWRISKLKYVGQALIGIIYSPDDVCEEEDGILVLRSSNVQEGILAFNDNVYVKISKNIQEKHFTREGDILICARNGSAHLVGKCAYISEKYAGLTFGAFMSIFRSDYGRFMYYFFSSNIFKSQTGLFTTSTINQLTSETLNNLASAIPPLTEQQAIVTYLDQKTALIDELIAKKERKIELLKENRTAIINHAVTKGLDSAVKYKPSGIEWIGEIPEGWDFKKLKFVANKIDELPESNELIFAVENIESGTGRLVGLDKELEYEGSLAGFKKGDTVFNKLRPYLAKVYFAESSGGYYGELLTIRGNSSIINEKFLYQILSSRGFMEIVNSSTEGTKMPRANWESSIKLIEVPIPTLLEQQKIITYLNTQTNLIDQTINLELQKIEKLKEYRQSLISNVVTGKVCVLRQNIQ